MLNLQMAREKSSSAMGMPWVATLARKGSVQSDLQAEILC